MILQVLVVLGLTCVTVTIHALGTLEAIAHLSRVWRRRKDLPGLLVSEIQIARVVSLLLLLHLLEAGVWAAFYWISETLPSFPDAIYFSITSYTTVGYGDLVLPAPWRLLGPIEAAVGILMFGWSTSIMVAAISRIHGSRLRLEASPDDRTQNQANARPEP